MAKAKPQVPVMPETPVPEKSVIGSVVDSIATGIDHILHPQHDNIAPTPDIPAESNPSELVQHKKFDKFKTNLGDSHND